MPLIMERFFSVFGKIALVIIVAGSLTWAGFYFGQKTRININQAISQTENRKDNTEQEQPVPKPTSSTENTPKNKVTGGVSKSAGLSFDQYTLDLPVTWSFSKENQTLMDEKLIMTKDGYSITIFQGATGGALCLYPGDSDFEGPSSKFSYYKELTSQDGRTLRRSGETNGTAFTVCQKSTDGSFGQPTNYGHISIKLPSAWDENGLKEIDAIITSLKKV